MSDIHGIREDLRDRLWTLDACQSKRIPQNGIDMVPHSLCFTPCADAWAAFFVTVEKRREERVRQTIPVYEA